MARAPPFAIGAFGPVGQILGAWLREHVQNESDLSAGLLGCLPAYPLKDEAAPRFKVQLVTRDFVFSASLALRRSLSPSDFPCWDCSSEANLPRAMDRPGGNEVAT